MARITEAALKKELKSGAFSRVYFLYGEEDFLVRTYIDKIAAAAVPEDARDMNFARYKNAPDPQELSDYLDSVPFFSEYKCAVIEDLELDALDAAAQKAYLTILESVPETSVLIIGQLHISPETYNGKKVAAKPKKLIETAEKYGSVCEFRYMKIPLVAGIITRRIERAGCSVSEENALFLAEECGASLTVLSNETDKLCAYKQSGEITREDIEALVPRKIDAEIYSLADAVLAGKTDEAFRILDELVLQNNEPHRIFSVMSDHFVELYRAKLAIGAGAGIYEAAAAYSYPPNRSFIMKNAFAKAKRFSLRFLSDCLVVLYRTNRLLNSSKADKRLLVERAVAEIAAIEH